MDTLKIIRPLNLIIIAITQIIFWFRIILPTFQQHQISHELGNKTFIALCLMTILLTGAGYVINDIYDAEEDKINKPDKFYLGGRLSPNKAYFYYLALNFVAFLAMGYIYYKTRNLLIFPIYFGVLGTLYAYARILKSTIFIGNLTVSMLLGFVSFIFYVFEYQVFKQLLYTNEHIFYNLTIVIIAFSSFSMGANFVREVVKDSEDRIGDYKAGKRTIATVYGYNVSNNFVTILSIILLMSLGTWTIYRTMWDQILELVYFSVLIVFPFLLIIYLINTGRNIKSKFRRISDLLKWIMVFGLLYLSLFIEIA